MQKRLKQTIDSREVAEMVGKNHAMLLRDLRRYEKQFTECNLAVSEFFRESEYKDSTGRTLPCYHITKKGCEFIAHKLTGIKGTAFTARYINRFHEMENTLDGQRELPEQQAQVGLAQLQAAVEKQGKILDNISRRLAGSTVLGIGSRNEQDMYRCEIVRIIESMQDREALCKVYTFAKYVPQMTGK